jgi:hypothetical protein
MFGMFKKGGSSEEIEGYTPTGPGTDIATSGGRRRRKSLRRKGARKGARKGMSKKSRKHYGGKSYQKHQNYYSGGDGEGEGNGDGVQTQAQLQAEANRLGALKDPTEEDKKRLAELAEQDIIPQEPEIITEKGGSRRRKSRHNKKTHSKKTRGKKTSPWIKHVLQFAKDNKMKYFQALKDKRCRATYKSSK